LQARGARPDKTASITVPSKATKTFTTAYAYNNLGQMERMVYPDGEALSYGYDYGGQLASASGTKGSVTEQYVKDIAYDEFGSRTSALYGNGAASEYTYDPVMRRLTSLRTTQGGRVLQNLAYEYDRVGNVLRRTNNGFVTQGETSKNSEQTYAYDDMHRLVTSDGTYTSDKGENTYHNSFTYNSIGNILSKIQTNDFDPSDGPKEALAKTTYTFNYTYGAKPHAVLSTGDTAYTYDANGNMVTMKNKDLDRKISWDAENRITKTVDNSIATDYTYDDQGSRVIKKGQYGEVLYVNSNYALRNGAIESKQIFAGNTRVATKMANKGTDQGTYYYHGDHLASSNSITTRTGAVHEYLDYFPYGETWVQEKASETATSMPYKFTSKELDPETGLYSFEHRYYDPKVGRWLTVDPPMVRGEYFPKPNDMDTDHDYYWYVSNNETSKLPGMGGVFNPVNLNVYHYAGLNPVKLVDPDGNAFVKIINKEDTVSYKIRQQFPNSRVMGFVADVLEPSPADYLIGPAIIESGGARIARPLLQGIKSFFKNLFRGGKLNSLLRAGNEVYGNGLTVAGRALQKHGSRIGSVFPRATGSVASINTQAESVLRGIITDPNVTNTIRHHARFGNVLECRIPGGQGARFSSDGNRFIGFIEP